MADADITSKTELELRRGVVVLATLSQLREYRYGYELRQLLAEQEMHIEEGTLYPLLRRLEAKGLLDSEWRKGEGPARRYYILNAKGLELLGQLRRSWEDLNRSMQRLLETSERGTDQ